MIYLDVDLAITVPVNVVALTDDTDFKTRETGITYDQAGMDLVWNFITSAGVITQTAVTPTTAGVYDWSHVGDAMYKIEIPASGGASINNDTEGYGYFTGICTGVLAWRGPTIGFRAAGLNNLLLDSAYSATRGLAGTFAPDAAVEAAGGLYTRGSGAGQINQPANGVIDTNVLQISGDVTAADNLELQYDTTGLAGDTFPATQSQINQVANVSGQAKRAPASYVLTTGTQSANTITATEELDGTRHEHTDTTGAMDLYYEFNVGSGIATEIKFTGYLQGNNDNLEVYGYDWVSVGWKQIGTLNGKAGTNNEVNEYDLLVNMVGSGADEGKVRVRFTDGAFTLTTATLAIDQLLVVFSINDGAYENGAIWLDTNESNTNTVRGVDGRASNPVSTIAAVNTLLASANLRRVEVAPSSSVTFAASQDNQQFFGNNWTLSLGGQSISGSYIEGADVTGIGTGASEIHFNHCHLGSVTLPPCDCENCLLEGTFTIGTAGDFFFEGCNSGIAGTSTPILDFGAALNSSDVSFRGYSGGIEIQNMGAGTGSYNMSLEGDGQLVINANCSATSTVAIRGHFTVTDNASGAVVLNDQARYEVRTGYDGGAVWINTNLSNTNTVSFVDGTADNPVSTLAAATTIAGNVNIKKFHLVPGSSITLAQAYDDYVFNACHSTIALGGQSVNNAIFYGAVITGNDDGSNADHVQYFDCVIGTNTLGQFVMTRCYFAATLTLAQAGSYFLHQCFSGIAGTSTPTLDFGSALNASNVNIRDYSGGMEIANMGAGTGSYNMSLEGFGQLIIASTCSPTSTIAIRGNFTITDNVAGGFVAGGGVISDEARFDVTQVTGGAYPLDTDANGRIRIVDGTGVGELDTASGGVKLSDVAMGGSSLVLTMKQLVINNDSGTAVDIDGTTSGVTINSSAGNSVALAGGGNGAGLSAVGAGAGSGVYALGGASGDGVFARGFGAGSGIEAVKGATGYDIEAEVDLDSVIGTLTQANIGWVDANSRVDVSALGGDTAALTVLAAMYGGTIATGTVNAVTDNGDFTLTSTDLTTNDNDYDAMWLILLENNNKFVPRVIGTYTGATKRVQFTGSGLKGDFPQTVQAGDDFAILAGSV